LFLYPTLRIKIITCSTQAKANFCILYTQIRHKLLIGTFKSLSLNPSVRIEDSKLYLFLFLFILDLDKECGVASHVTVTQVTKHNGDINFVTK